MLEQLDLDLSIPKTTYKKELPLLQANLYDLAHEAFTRKIPTIIVFEGWATSGKGGAIGVLTERLDPRGLRVIPILPPRTTETHYPWMWRFWNKIPGRGQIVAFDLSWYRRVLVERVTKVVKRREWEQAYQDIAEFEEQLAKDGTNIIKFWFHISKQEQGKRIKKLLKDKLTAWQVPDEDLAQHKAYNKYLEAAEEMLARTDAPHSPWTLVEATDRYYTRKKVLDTIIRALEVRLGTKVAPVTEPKKEAAHA